MDGRRSHRHSLRGTRRHLCRCRERTHSVLISPTQRRCATGRRLFSFRLNDDSRQCGRTKAHTGSGLSRTSPGIELGQGDLQRLPYCWQTAVLPEYFHRRLLPEVRVRLACPPLGAAQPILRLIKRALPTHLAEHPPYFEDRQEVSHAAGPSNSSSRTAW